METVIKEYAAFERAMDEESIYRELDYEGICDRLGADPERLENLLISELGFEGQALVDFYRANFG